MTRNSNTTKRRWLAAAKLLAAGLVCCTFNACAMTDAYQTAQSDVSATRAAAAHDAGSAPQLAPVVSVPQPAQPNLQQQDLQTRIAPPSAPKSDVALASYAETPQQRHPHPGRQEQFAQAHTQAGNAQTNAAVSQAVHRQDPANPHNHVRQVDWHQCPTCTPVMPSGPECYSLEYDNYAPLRFRDEYICDGGDLPLSVYIDKRMKVQGLNLEDTVAHYVTEAGKVVVEPSTRTCIYAPRFAAVRQIHSLAVNEHSTLTGSTGFVAVPTLAENRDVPTDLNQPTELAVSSGAAKLHENRDRNRATPETGVTALLELNRDWLPFENFDYVRNGTMLGSEKARLAISAQNAVTWTGDLAVQAIIDETPVEVAAAATGLESMHEYIAPDGKPRLRVLKLADRDNAHPGDEVQFTLRFDNIGDQKINQVVLLDNLSGRLEYVDGTSECTLPAEFSTELNDGESLTLRWELKEPLEVGKGGVIRFKCKVR